MHALHLARQQHSRTCNSSIVVEHRHKLWLAQYKSPLPTAAGNLANFLFLIVVGDQSTSTRGNVHRTAKGMTEAKKIVRSDATGDHFLKITCRVAAETFAMNTTILWSRRRVWHDNEEARRWSETMKRGTHHNKCENGLNGLSCHALRTLWSARAKFQKREGVVSLSQPPRSKKKGISHFPNIVFFSFAANKFVAVYSPCIRVISNPCSTNNMMIHAGQIHKQKTSRGLDWT
jgi:hypothetical protein